MVELYAPVRPVQPGFGSPDMQGMQGAEDEPRMMNLIDPPVQREGFVEQRIHTYEIIEDEPGAGDISAKVG